MLKKILLFMFVTTVCYAQPIPTIDVTEEDGSPVIYNPYSLKFPNGSVVDNADGTVSVDTYSSISADLIPDTDNFYDIGTHNTLEWKDMAVDGIAYIDGFGQNALPATTSAYDLGSFTNKWKDLHLSGSAYIQDFAQDILPKAANSYDIGSAAFPFDKIYADTIIATTADIEGAIGSDDLTDVCNRGCTTDENLTSTGDITGENLISSNSGTFGSVNVDNITLDVNIISSSSGEISFSDENLTTTGNIQAANLTATSNITVGGTLEIEDVVVNNDLTVTNSAEISTFNFASGSLTDDTGNINFGDERLTTTGRITAGRIIVDNLTLDTNVIASDTGVISFDNDTITTTGAISGNSLTSATTAAITGALSSGSYTDGTLSVIGGNISSANTITAEQLTTTDDLSVGDVATISTMEITSGSITDTTGAISFGNENITMGGATVMGGTLNVVGDVTLGSVTTGNVKPLADLAYEIGGESIRYSRVSTREIRFDPDTYISFDGNCLSIYVNGSEKSRDCETATTNNIIYAGEQVVYAGENVIW